VRAREVLETIAKHAFDASPYPLVLSLEDHLSFPQQQVFAQYVREVFEKDVVPDSTTRFWESNPQSLTSPESLQYKILIKHKANEHRETQNVSTRKPKIAPEMSDLVVYTKSVTFSTLENSIVKFKCYEMASFAEKKGLKLVKNQPNTFIDFSTAHLARSYPDGMVSSVKKKFNI